MPNIYYTTNTNDISDDILVVLIRIDADFKGHGRLYFDMHCKL